MDTVASSGKQDNARQCKMPCIPYGTEWINESAVHEFHGGSARPRRCPRGKLRSRTGPGGCPRRRFRSKVTSRATTPPKEGKDGSHHQDRHQCQKVGQLGGLPALRHQRRIGHEHLDRLVVAFDIPLLSGRVHAFVLHHGIALAIHHALCHVGNGAPALGLGRSVASQIGQGRDLAIAVGIVPPGWWYDQLVVLPVHDLGQAAGPLFTQSQLLVLVHRLNPGWVILPNLFVR
mmetsp:Transcript_9887/g.29352  ORF Transcript_9887/g.29352 Transcript_9887/m.29352 type:complete len:232 (+) Transcript_9887:150-845(+)